MWLLVGAAGWAVTVAVSVYAYRTSGAGAVAAVTAARLLPAVLAAPLTGGLVDRGDRARVAAIACAVEAICLSATAALVLRGAPVALVALLAAGASAAATAPRPALQALMPALATSPEQLTRCTALWGAIDSLGFLVGGGLGGVTIAAAGSGAVVAASAVTVALAGCLAVGLPSVAATPDPEVDEGLTGALEGLRAIVRSPLLRAPFILFAGLLLLEGSTDVQLVALSLGKLGMGNGGIGVLYVPWGVGGLLGSTAIVALVRRRGYGLALGGGAFAFAGGLALAGLGGVALVLVAMVLAGLGFALVETAVMGVVPRLADDAVVGRVYAMSEILYAGAAGLGALIAPGLIDLLGVGGSLVAVAGAFALAGALSSRSYERLDRGQGEAARVRELLRGIRFLRALPLPQLERLVRAAGPMAVPGGTTVVRRGDTGHRFFVIEAGIVEIVEYGRRQGPGEAFGEIALLRDIPRTVTVRALTDVRLWALDRARFVAAVSGHREASELADSAVAEHLAAGPLADGRGGGGQ